MYPPNANPPKKNNEQLIKGVINYHCPLINPLIRPQFLGELEFGGYPETPMIICSHCYLVGVDSKMGRSLFINMRPVCPVYRHSLTAYIYVYIYVCYIYKYIDNILVQQKCSRIIIGAHTHTSRPGENMWKSFTWYWIPRKNATISKE